jgi:hypothetical protein
VPIAVMGDHTHKTGEIMLSYRYMQEIFKPTSWATVKTP